jgi:hypothetical protein
MRISVGSLAPVGTYTVEIRARCGAVTKTAKFQLTITEGAFNFTVSVQPSSSATIQGGSVEATVTVSLVSGLPRVVELSAQNLPEGASASFNPQSGNPTFQSALTVSTSETTPLGTYDILIVGVGGGVERSATFTLTVAEGVAEVVFSAEGIGSDNDGMVLYVDGEVYANLPQAFSWQVGSEHSFEWVSPVGTQTWGKRYVWTSTRGLSTGRSGSIFVPSGGGSIIAVYKTQYYLTMQVDPADGGSVSPESGWFDADGAVEVSAFPAEGYMFSGWMGEGEGSYSGADNPATVTMNGPVRETACFVQMLPWLSGWSLRKSHEIAGSTAGPQTDYQVRITAYYGVGTDTGESVYLNGKCRADFGDVRFTASDGTTLLNYWIETYTASSSAVFWVKVPYIPASPDTATIYIYYGNPSATTTSNGEATFPAFFNGENYISGTIDPDGWTNVYGWGSGGGGTIERGVTMERVYSGIRSYILRINSYNNKYRDGRMNLYKPVTGGDFRFVGKINVDVVSSGQYGATAGFIVAFNIGGTWKAIYYRFAYAASDIKALYYRDGVWYTPDYQINIANTQDSWLSLDRALASDFQAAGFGDWSQVTDIIVYMAVRATDGPGSGYTGDARAFYDNVYLRKYVDPEPSHGAWGSEEILP